MNLIQALRLPLVPCLAAVGAGGKTSMLFQLGFELLDDPSRNCTTVLLSTTTHLAKWQVDLADYQFVLDYPERITELGSKLPSGLVVITAAMGEDQRMAGLDEFTMLKLKDLSDRSQLPLLIEADGARLRPLKAPDVSEPAIHQFIQQVVVCAGLSSLGQPVSPEWIHRPERFSALVGVKPGEIISSDALYRLLTHPQGGLKNIPASSSRAALLTQADSPELQAQAGTIAEGLRTAYDQVLISSRRPGQSGEQQLSQLDVLAVHEPVAAVVLAAGGAKRYGYPKQLLSWHGKPFVRQVAETALGAGLWPVIVVLGAYSDQVMTALEDLPVTIVNNPTWEAGQATSIHSGLRSLPENLGGVVFLLCDQPQIPAQLIQTMIETHRQTLAPVIAPMIAGQRGNPVLFDRSTFSAFSELKNEQGGRALFSRYRVNWVPWHDSSLLLDVDTPEDYQRLLEE